MSKSLLLRLDTLFQTESLLYVSIFNNFSFFHIRRQSNSMAHNLVIHVKYISDLSVWMKDATPHLNNVLLADYD